jgi:hypothetical protein
MMCCSDLPMLWENIRHAIKEMYFDQPRSLTYNSDLLPRAHRHIATSSGVEQQTEYSDINSCYCSNFRKHDTPDRDLH